MNITEASKIITDDFAVRILIEAARHPVSVLDMSFKLNIPLAACHSRIKLLEENSLIHCLKMPLTEEGTHAYVYVTDYNNMEILFSNFQEELDLTDSTSAIAEDAQA